MTIPKKGRRSINVDGMIYYYKISFERSGRIIIQDADCRGGCLFVFPHTIMKPVHISDAIRFALSTGWLNDGAGDDCWLAFDTDVESRTLLEFIPNDDFRVATYSMNREMLAEADLSRYPDTRMWYERPIIPQNNNDD